tara:strand:- start:1627 stop:2031 length:405 start_codon:yes stop_codon:yes gene_type:complete
MKKLLITIIFLTALSTQNLYASCSDDVKGSWEYTSNKTQVNYTWKNYGDKSIVITRVGLITANSQYVKKYEKELGIKPFGVRTYQFYVGDVNLDVVTHGSWNCRYGNVAVKKSTPFKPKQKSGSQKFLEKILGN